MAAHTTLLSLENPVFQTYVLAASIMILKLMLQPWMTVSQRDFCSCLLIRHCCLLKY